jgi:hypothetical protein
LPRPGAFQAAWSLAHNPAAATTNPKLLSAVDIPAVFASF